MNQVIENALRIARAPKAVGGEDTAKPTPLAGPADLGFTGPWYHGSGRLDRLVGSGRIDPRRATSGPMPFFTDNPEIASNYAKGKDDTSLAAQDTGDVANYFKVHPKALGMSGRTPIPVERSWHFLSPEERQEIASKVLRVGHADPDTGEGPLILHHEGENASIAPEDHYAHTLKEHRGNHLAALRDIWHDSGELIGNEGELARVYQLAGYRHPISQESAPWTEAKGVMPAMLRMRNPLHTADTEYMLKTVIPHLERTFKRDRSRKQRFGADMWDKNHHYTPKEWIADLKADLEKGENSHVFTSIPDKITDALKALGHDAIIDTGGKMGGQGHTVAVPFYPHQVRGVFAKFSPDHLDSPDFMRSRGGRTQKAHGGHVRKIKLHVGPIHSAVAGRTDHLPAHVPNGSYVVPAENVAHLGEGNTIAGFKVLRRVFGGVPYGQGAGPYGQGNGPYGEPLKRGGQAEGDDPGVPVVVAGGEYVLHPDQVRAVGEGDLDLGHRVLDEWMKRLAAEHIETLKKLPPPRVN